MAKAENVAMDADPRPLDRENKHRLRVLIHRQKIHPTNGCVLYCLRDDGRITTEQCDAGDRYWTLTRDYRKVMDSDPEEKPEAQRELLYKRIDSKKKRYKEALESMGIVRKHVDDVVFNDCWPVGERGHLAVCQGLELLNIFFNTGTKRKRQNVV